MCFSTLLVYVSPRTHLVPAVGAVDLDEDHLCLVAHVAAVDDVGEALGEVLQDQILAPPVGSDLQYKHKNESPILIQCSTVCEDRSQTCITAF